MARWSLFNFLGSMPPGQNSPKLRRPPSSEVQSSSHQDHQSPQTTVPGNELSRSPHDPFCAMSPGTPRKRTILPAKGASSNPKGSPAETRRPPAQNSLETDILSSGRTAGKSGNFAGPANVTVNEACELTVSAGGFPNAGPNDSFRAEKKFQPRRGTRERKPVQFFDGSTLSPMKQDSISPIVPKKRKVSDADADADADFEPPSARPPKRKRGRPKGFKKQEPQQDPPVNNNAAKAPMNVRSAAPKKRGKPRRIVSIDKGSHPSPGRTTGLPEISQDYIAPSNTQIEKASNRQTKNKSSTPVSRVSKTNKQSMTGNRRGNVQQVSKPKSTGTRNSKGPVDTAQRKDVELAADEEKRSCSVQSKDQTQVSGDQEQALVQEQSPIETSSAPDVATQEIQDRTRIRPGFTLESTEPGDTPVSSDIGDAISSAAKFDGDLDFGGDWFDMPKYKRDLIVKAMDENGMDAQALAAHWKPIFDRGQARSIAQLLSDSAARGRSEPNRDNALGIIVNRAAIYGDTDKEDQEDLEFEQMWGGLRWMHGEIQRQRAEVPRLKQDEERLGKEEGKLVRYRREALEGDIAWLRERSLRLVDELTRLQGRREKRRVIQEEEEEHNRLRELFARGEYGFDEHHAPPPPSWSPPPFSPPSPPSALLSAASSRPARPKRNPGDAPNRVALTSPTDADDELTSPSQKRRATTVSIPQISQRTSFPSEATQRASRGRAESPESNLIERNQVASTMNALDPSLHNDNPQWTQMRDMPCGHGSLSECHSESDEQ